MTNLEILLKLGEYSAAYQSLTTAQKEMEAYASKFQVPVDRTKFQAQYALAICCLEIGGKFLQEAEIIFGSLIQSRPEDVNYLRGLMRVLLEQGSLDKACDISNMILQKDPNRLAV